MYHDPHGHSPLTGPHVRDKEISQSVSDKQSETCSHGTVLINVTVTQAYAGKGDSHDKKPMSLASANIRPLDKHLMGAPFHGLGSDQTFKVDVTHLVKAFIHAYRISLNQWQRFLSSASDLLSATTGLIASSFKQQLQ